MSKALIYLIVIFATGCMVGPDYHPPKPSAPPGWVGVKEAQPATVTNQPADLAQWWQQLRDPIMTSLINEAVKANLSIALSEASLRQARALRGVAAAPLWPSATASGTIQREAGDLYVENGRSRNLFQAGFDAAWEMDLFGAVRRNVESANANVQVAIENIRDVQVSITAEAALNYVQLRGYQQQIVVARNKSESSAVGARSNAQAVSGGF